MNHSVCECHECTQYRMAKDQGYKPRSEMPKSFWDCPCHCCIRKRAEVIQDIENEAAKFRCEEG